MILVASTAILKDDRVLMIRENKLPVQGKWNFPSGRVEPGEDIRDAARREAREETGYDVRLTGTTGVYPFVSCTNHSVLLFHFTAEITGGSPQWPAEEISDCRWNRLQELLTMDPAALREPALIHRITENLLRGVHYPLTLLHQL